MRIIPCEFQVLGIGHLAAAVRLRLRSRSLSPESDIERACAGSPVFIACSDYDSAPSFAAVDRLAREHRESVLFAWISRGLIKIGPLVVPLETACVESHPPQRWDFSLSDTPCRFMPGAQGTAPNPDLYLQSLARLGAWLVVRELAGLQFGSGALRLIGRVAEFGPGPPIEGRAWWWPSPRKSVRWSGRGSGACPDGILP